LTDAEDAARKEQIPVRRLDLDEVRAPASKAHGVKKHEVDDPNEL